VAGFGGQLCHMVSPGKVMAEDESDKFKRQPPTVADDGNRSVGSFDDPQGAMA